MLDADVKVIDEFTNTFNLQFSSIYQYCKGGRGHLAVAGDSLMAGQASFDVKRIRLNQFRPGL